MRAWLIGLLLLGSPLIHSEETLPTTCSDFNIRQEAYINCVSALQPTAAMRVSGHVYHAYRVSYDLWLVYKNGALLYYSKTEVTFA